MRNLRFVSIIMIMVMLIASAAAVSVSAEPVVDPNNPGVVDPGVDDPGYVDPGYDDPGYTEPGYVDPGVDDPGYVDPGYTEPGYVDPGYVDPGYDDPGYVDPGYDNPGYIDPGYDNPGYIDPGYEYDEYNAPATHSVYENTVPLYDTDPIQNPETDYEEIKLEELSLDTGNETGMKDFNTIKNNTSRGDEVSPALLVIGLILVFLSIAGFTFVIMFRPDKKKPVPASSAPVRRTSSSHSSGYTSQRTRNTDPRVRERREMQQRAREARSNHDYDDGY